jgi:hypothetical protein
VRRDWRRRLFLGRLLTHVMRQIKQHAEPISAGQFQSYFNPIDAKTIGVYMPYSTLKYLQQKARNQVPSTTSADSEPRAKPGVLLLIGKSNTLRIGSAAVLDGSGRSV